MHVKAKHVFDTHPTVDVLHETSDKTLFFKKEDAEAHAQFLKTRSIADIHRAAVEAEAEAEKKAEEQKAEEAKKTAKALEEAKAKKVEKQESPAKEAPKQTK